LSHDTPIEPSPKDKEELKPSSWERRHQDDPDEIRALVLQLLSILYHRFGIAHIIAFATLLLGLALWLGWPLFADSFAVNALYELIDPLPKASQERFTILVARFERDENHQLEELLLEDLNEIQGIKVIQLRRTISTTSDSEESERNASQKARYYLKQTGAQVLLWGRAIEVGGSGIIVLYCTTHKLSLPRRLALTRLAFTENLGLPEGFLNDLTEVVALTIVTQGADYYAANGQFVAGKLAQFVVKVQTLLDGSVGQNWNPDIRAKVTVTLAHGLVTLGEQTGENHYLNQAISRYDEVLKYYTKEKYPKDWARVEGDLGNAQKILGERESGTASLQKAVDAYQAALLVLTRESAPLDWAKTQNDLGNALLAQGEREAGTEHLERAIAAYRAARLELSSEGSSLDLAATMNNLGTALVMLSSRESGTDTQRQAVSAYRDALKIYSRDKTPLEWAKTQNNLGLALQDLGNREPSIDHLQYAVAAYRAALSETRRERSPLVWAQTQNNLGTALVALSERESGNQHLYEAIAAYHAALEEFTRERVPREWASTMNRLGDAFGKLGERERQPSLICSALEIETEAWETSHALGDVYGASRTAIVGLRQASLLTSQYKQTERECLTKYESSLQKMKAWQQKAPIVLN